METRRILMRSLAVAVVIVTVICTTTAEENIGNPCCTKVSTAVVTDPIIGIRFQRESLPCMKAVIFETERGESCSDPKQRWVREKVKQFLKKISY
ncbi:C-C motif chemokine 20-like [Onychostoma macrolepis]|uniref:C-C motif chemokine 20-like n=1 Tax=Onychostoma macrolepis TaxID=369639 RepID=UPI00272CBA11|nr:C-C motif chemokine 20-like [Onychostoma macrolepis]